MTNFPYGNPSPNPLRPRSLVRPIVLLILITVIAILLWQGLLAFPGLFFWFIGGDLMQFWFIALLVLGLLYRGSILRLWRRNRARRAQGFVPEYLVQPVLPLASSIGKLTRGVLQLPVLLLFAFMVYYFFFIGYTFHVGTRPTVIGDCNGGTITVIGKTDSDTVSLRAGLLTIEGYGNYDSASHTLNITGNLCGFTLEVPATTDLHLSGNDATISVTGITGKIEVDNNAGDINIDGSTLLAGSNVENNAGKITIDNSCVMPGVKVESNGSPITKNNIKSCG